MPIGLHLMLACEPSAADPGRQAASLRPPSRGDYMAGRSRLSPVAFGRYRLVHRLKGGVGMGHVLNTRLSH